MICKRISYYRPKTWFQLLSNKHSILNTRSISYTSKGSKSRDTYFITTPIFYVNSDPHIGHLYTTALADTLARWQKLKGSNVLFTTGTDEHGLKIQQAAAKCGVKPMKFCDEIAGRFKVLFQQGNIQYDDFIRTTEERHINSVHTLWKKLVDKDLIYKGNYEGWYSTSDEAFLSDLDIEEVTGADGKTVKVSKESGHIVEWIKEDNYMFRLSEFASKLTQWVDKKVIHPSHPYEETVRKWIDELEDLSVSRQRERLTWGVPVPGDSTQTIYVWLDALTNYLTVCGFPSEDYKWSNVHHLVGKDILKFHAIYWPAFLMAAGIEPPTAILCHAHWLKDYKKMSKSIGNVVHPSEAIKKYSTDGLRYFLLREGLPQSDGNYSDDRIVVCLNSEVVNTMGNLLNRCIGSKVNIHHVIPAFCPQEFAEKADDEDRKMWDNLGTLADEVNKHFENFEIYQGINAAMAQLRDTNAFVHKQKIWELAEDKTSEKQLNNVLHVSLHTLRIVGILLQPVIPELSGKLLDRLNVPVNERMWEYASYRDFGDKSLSRSLGKNTGLLMKRLK